MKTKAPQKQEKISVSLDKYPDVSEMFNRALAEIKPKPTKVALVVEAMREYLVKREGTLKNNGHRDEAVENLEKQIADLKMTPMKQLSEKEQAIVKKKLAELEADLKKRKGGK